MASDQSRTTGLRDRIAEAIASATFERNKGIPGSSDAREMSETWLNLYRPAADKVMGVLAAEGLLL